MVSHYAVYVPFANRVRGPSCKLQNDFFFGSDLRPRGEARGPEIRVEKNSVL